MREDGSSRGECEAEARPEARPLAQGERALERRKRQERRERVPASLDAVEDREREDRVEGRREKACVRPAQPLADEDEKRKVEERRDERQEPNGDVRRARRGEGQEQSVRGKVVERRPGVDAESREDFRDVPTREREREDLVGPERPRKHEKRAREEAGRGGRCDDTVNREFRAASLGSHPGFFRALVSRRRASSASSASRYFDSAGLRRIASS